MRARHLVSLAFAISLTGALVATSAQAVEPDSPEARVRLTGELVSTAVEVPGGQQYFAVRSKDQIVPVSGDDLADIAARSEVTLDVTVPDDIVDAAAADTTISVPATGGRPVQHDLSPADLDAATDDTPAAAASPIGEATTDTPMAPGANALPVARVVTVKTAAASYTPATRRITYVEVTPRGVTRSPFTSAAATKQIAGADSFWRDNSRNTLKIGAPTVKAHYKSPYSCTDDPFAMWDDVAHRVGYTYKANSSLALKVPTSAHYNNDCSWGLGTIGDNPNDWGLLYTASKEFSVPAHELGHNMSLGHANALSCRGRSDAVLSAKTGRWSNACEEEEYGDYLDVMGPDTGSTSAMLSSPQALRTGMLDRAATVTVGPGTSTVTLAPMSKRNGLRVAVVKNAITKNTYYVEYRTASGRDAPFADYQVPGVKVLRYNPHPSETSSVLLDPTPSGYLDGDPALAAGKTVTSHDRRIKVTTVSANASGATVKIVNDAKLRPFANKSAPTITGTKGVGKRLSASQGSWSPTPKSYSYRWKRNGKGISGASKSSYTPTTADAGRYLTVTITAKRSGYANKAVTSKRVGIPIHATNRPSIRGTAKAGSTLTVVFGKWTPRPTSYKYQWYRDGVAISGKTAKTYKVTSRDRGKRIQVRVHALRSGYSTGSMRTYSKTIAR